MAQAAHLQRQCQVLPDRHVGVERVALEHHGDVAPLWRHAVDRSSANADLAAVLGLETGDNAQHGGFPAAGRADQGQKLAPDDGERDTAQDRSAGKALYDPCKFHRRHEMSCPSPQIGSEGRARPQRRGAATLSPDA